MKIRNDLEQSSPEWLFWRLDMVTGTDAGKILGLDEYCDIYTLWEQKLEMVPPVKETDAMRHGKDNEEIARSLFIERTGIIMEPLVIESDEHSWMGCSLDGYSFENNVILEVKCPVKINKHMPVYEGVISPHYHAQVQHQLACSGASECYFVSYHKDDPELIAINVIKPNMTFIKEMIEKEKKFYLENMCNFVPPEKPWQFEEKGR